MGRQRPFLDPNGVCRFRMVRDSFRAAARSPVLEALGLLCCRLIVLKEIVPVRFRPDEEERPPGERDGETSGNPRATPWRMVAKTTYVV